MLLSMTGFGDARGQDARMTVHVEVRTINNRYLKISVKTPEAYAVVEGDIEKIVREKISRGTVQVGLRIERPQAATIALNEPALKNYWEQLKRISTACGAGIPSDFSQLLVLPGTVLDQETRATEQEEEWPFIKGLLDQALDKLHVFRVDEGRSMQAELQDQARVISQQLGEVVALAPQVVSEYRQKLLERVAQTLADSAAAVNPADLIREVSIFADRSDINEEITRLRCHLEQFEAFMAETASAGRKLEFLSQEMFREINTIGSKANNVRIAHAVVEMKAAVEKIREILQNVE